MVTIAHLINKKMKDLPFIHEAMDKNIINFGGLAELLKPEVEKELNKKVKGSAVSMALRRFHDQNKSLKLKKIKLTEELDLVVKSNLFEVSIQKSPSIFKILGKIYELINFDLGDTLNTIQGNSEVLIISNTKYKKEILRILSKEKIKLINENLAALSMKIPESSISNPGFFFLITKILSWENINIVDMVNTATELTIILNKEDVTKAYNLFQDTINS